MISPTGDGINDTVTFSFALAQNVPVRVEIVQDGFAVATPFQGQLGVGPHAIDWDGTTNGVPLAGRRLLRARHRHGRARRRAALAAA